MCGQKRWLLTFSIHCLCSSTYNLFTSRFRLVYRSIKIANDLPIFASHYALLYTFVIVSLTWLAYFLSHDFLSYINSLGLLSVFYLFRIPDGVKMNALTSRNFLQDNFIPWYCSKHPAFRKKIIYMQDNAQSHSAPSTVEYLGKSWTEERKIDDIAVLITWP